MTDDLVKRLLEMCGDDGILAMRDIYDTDVAAAADRIEQLEQALFRVASANSGRDRFSAEIDKIVFSALKDDKHD